MRFNNRRTLEAHIDSSSDVFFLLLYITRSLIWSEIEEEHFLAAFVFNDDTQHV